MAIQVQSLWLVTGVRRRISGEIGMSWVLLYQLQFVHNKSHTAHPEIKLKSLWTYSAVLQDP